MKGEPAFKTAAALSKFAVNFLGAEKNLEVLGFTTRTWHGGISRTRWKAAGRPKKPGRLCDLMHIIYKSADDEMNVLLQNLPLMTLSQIFRENVDGEAILWAKHRAAQYQFQKAILIVISDGAPVDDSTLNENGPSFLENHLIEVISNLKKSDVFSVGGLGIKFDVNHYYSQSAKAETLDHILLGLTELFDLLLVPQRVKSKNGKAGNRAFGGKRS